MVTVNLQLVDFMDARPLPRARVEASLSVMPRYESVLAPEEADKPERVLEVDPRFEEVLTTATVTDDEGRVLLSFPDADVFRRLARQERPEQPRRPVDAVGFVRVGAQFLGARFDPSLLARDVERAAQLEFTLPVDLGMSIVGHTTSSGARLWFHLPFQPTPEQRFRCNVVTVPVNSPVAFPSGPLSDGAQLGLTFPVEFERAAANTAVVDVAGLAPDARHEYALTVELGLRRFALVIGGFRTPAATQPRLSFAFGSCHLPVVTGTPAEPSEAALRTLRHWQRLADRRDFEFLVLTGDQIYGDGIEQKWPAADDFNRYVLRYRQLWAHRPTRQVLRSSPTYMILDDHDVADDFGIANLDDFKVNGALDAYRLFQHAHGPGEGGPPFHYSFRWGPAAFFVMDGRTQRREGSPVFGRRQLRDLREWAASPETRDADIVFFVAPVPLALLPTEIIRKVARELAEQTVAAGGAILGTLVGLGVGAAVGGVPGAAAGAGIGAAVLGSIGYAVGDEVFESFFEGNMLLDADLGERWDLRDNQPDLVELLDLLFDLANGVGDDPPRKRAVFILSGDIHAATMHGIRSLPQGAGRRHQANPAIIQLTSSAISHSPVSSTLWVQAVSRIDEDVDVDLKDVNDLTILTGTVDWDTLSSGAIDVDDVFGEGAAEYFLDPNLERRYLTQYAGLLMERTVGFVGVERRDPQRRIYRFRLTIEGESRPLESRFELDLDADEIVPKTDDAAFVRHSVPRTIEPLRPVEVEVTMRNTGVTTWGSGYALDVLQPVWGIDRVAVGAAVAPGRERTFRFRIVAPSSGTFFFSAGMARGRVPFGEQSGAFAVRARPGAGGEGGEASCEELRAELRRLEDERRNLQAELSQASPAEKRVIVAQITRIRASLTAVGRLMNELGCT